MEVLSFVLTGLLVLCGQPKDATTFLTQVEQGTERVYLMSSDNTCSAVPAMATVTSVVEVTQIQGKQWYILTVSPRGHPEVTLFAVVPESLLPLGI